MGLEEHVEDVAEDRYPADDRVDAGIERDPGKRAPARAHPVPFVGHDRTRSRSHQVPEAGDQADDPVPADAKARAGKRELAVEGLRETVEPLDAGAALSGGR